MAIYKDGEQVDEVVEGDEALIVLNQTPFYAESGGQIGDTGLFKNETGIFEVQDTKKSGGAFVHQGIVTMGGLKAAQAVEAIVNALFALLEHDQLANISGVDGGTVHVTTAKVEEWDAKQEAVAPTAPAFPLLSTPLTPNRLLISNDDGQVAVSSVSESDIQMLQLS